MLLCTFGNGRDGTCTDLGVLSNALTSALAVPLAGSVWVDAGAEATGAAAPSAPVVAEASHFGSTFSWAVD